MEEMSAPDALHLLRLARAHGRSRTRSPNFFAYSDRFCAALLHGPLGVEPEHREAAGSDAQVIDFYYEQLLSGGEAAAPLLRETTLRLQEMATPSNAALAVPTLRSRLETSSCSLLDVACAVVAAITILGHESLSRKVSATAADRWLSLWQDYLLQQNRQQELHCGLCLLTRMPPEARSQAMAALDISPGALRPESGTFAEGVVEYLTNFSETGAVGVLLVGGLPFAEKQASDELRELIELFLATPEIIHLMTRLIRFAQDLKFDQEERINTGVFALAAEMGVDVVDIDARQVAKADVEEKLRHEWDVYSRECRRRADAVLSAASSREAPHRALADVVDAAFFLARWIASASYK